MPSFFVEKKFFLQYKSGLKDVELKNGQPRWKNSRIGDEALLMCGKDKLRKKK